jgi:surface antigen
LRGDAPEWWASAEGRYKRGRTPAVGAILVFARTARLQHGHVSVVSRVLSSREILVTHANWVQGKVTRDDSVADVSPENDWSVVRVWWEPAGQLGVTLYPLYGFITPDRRLDHEAIAAATGRAAKIAISGGS